MDNDSVLTKIYAMLGGKPKEVEVKAAQIKTEDGAVVLESENFAIGDAVFIVTKSDEGEDERLPLPEGTYILEDGANIVVDDMGVIANRTEKGEETEEVIEEEFAAPEAQTQTAKKVVETQSVTKETMFTKEELKTMQTDFADGNLGSDKLTKVVKFLFEDRFRWEIDEANREEKMSEMKGIAAQLSKLETDSEKEITDLKTVNVELTTELEDLKKSMGEAAEHSSFSPENKVDNNIKVHFGNQPGKTAVERAMEIINAN